MSDPNRVKRHVARFISESVGADAGALEAAVYGPENVSAAMFLDSVARTLAGVTQALFFLAEEIDALYAAIEPRDDPTNPR